MTLRWKNLPFQVHFEAWYLSCSCRWWLVLYIMAFSGALNRRAQSSKPLELLQVAAGLSKNGFLPREGRKGRFLLLNFENGSHCALYTWRPRHCPLLCGGVANRAAERVSVTLPAVVARAVSAAARRWHRPSPRKGKLLRARQGLRNSERPFLRMCHPAPKLATKVSDV